MKKFGVISNIRRKLRPGGVAWLVCWLAFAWIPGLGEASASMIPGGTQDSFSSTNDWFGNVPPADLSGFFGSGANPFPSEPNPSQIWTSAGNLATAGYWQTIIAEIALDPSLLPQFYGLGMNGSTPPGWGAPLPGAGSSGSQVSPLQVSPLQVSSTSPVLYVSNTGGSTPEPVSAALLAGGLLLLGIYARRRTASQAGAAGGPAGPGECGRDM